jgi:hypothetical protein
LEGDITNQLVSQGESRGATLSVQVSVRLNQTIAASLNLLGQLSNRPSCR